jgi:ketosteroid isomerase-like protein
MNFEDRLETLEAGLKTLTAKDEIWQLIARYARAVDEEIDAELAAIFTEDTVFQTIPWTGEPLVGRDNAVKAFKSYLRRFNNRKRFITNERIDITGADSATAWSNWLVLHANDGESYVGWGSYDWDFARIDGAWLISKMVITVDCMTTLENGWGDAEKLVAGYPGSRDR